MSTAEVKFSQDAAVHRETMLEDLADGKAKYPGHLNMSAYRQGKDPQYTGWIGNNCYAKPWGNDSSNIQAVLNGPGYWKRVYYRQDPKKEPQRSSWEAPAQASQAASSSGGGTIRKNASEGSMQKLPAEDALDGYGKIKETMREFVLEQGKPRVKPLQMGERLNFWNTLDHKYQMKAGGKNLTWDVSKGTHRSTKNEMRWIASQYFRTDTPHVLGQSSSAPALARK
jgi:hypothetical protein